MSKRGISTAVFNDGRVKYIREFEKDGEKLALLWIYIMLLAEEISQNGSLLFTSKIPYDALLISNEVGLNEATVKRGLDIFVKLEMLDFRDGIYSIRRRGRKKGARGKKKKGELLELPPQKEYKLNDLFTEKELVEMQLKIDEEYVYHYAEVVCGLANRGKRYRKGEAYLSACAMAKQDGRYLNYRYSQALGTPEEQLARRREELYKKHNLT